MSCFRSYLMMTKIHVKFHLYTFCFGDCYIGMNYYRYPTMNLFSSLEFGLVFSSSYSVSLSTRNETSNVDFSIF